MRWVNHERTWHLFEEKEQNVEGFIYAYCGVYIKMDSYFDGVPMCKDSRFFDEGDIYQRCEVCVDVLNKVF